MAANSEYQWEIDRHRCIVSSSSAVTPLLASTAEQID
jgi:hypothetical protein